MLVFLFVALLFLTLLSRDIRIEVNADVDALKNRGGFTVRVFGVKVYAGEFHAESKDITHNNLVIEHKKSRAEVHLSADKEDKDSVISYMGTPLFSNLRIKNIDLNARLGLAHDSFITTMAFGTARILLYSALSFIKSRYQAKISESFMPDYHSDRLDFNLYAKIYISPGDLVYGFGLLLVKKAKELMVKHKLTKGKAAAMMRQKGDSL